MDAGSNAIHIDVTPFSEIVASGEIDFTNVGKLREAIYSAVESNLGAVVALDLSSAVFLDASAISTLITSRRFAADRGCKLAIRSASPQIKRTLQLSGFAGMLGLPILRIESYQPPRDVSSDPQVEWDIRESVSLGEPQMARYLRDLVLQAAQKSGLGEDDLIDLQIAVGEALSNAFRHGCPKGSDSKVRVKCLSCQSGMVIEITDEGEAYDFDAVLTDDRMREEEPAVGIKLIHRAVDDVECVHTGKGNRLRMIKWFRQS